MEAGEQNIFKNLFQSTWKTEFAKSISELYTYGKKSKSSSNPKDIFKRSKKLWEILNQRNNFRGAATKVLSKISKKKKISNQ